MEKIARLIATKSKLIVIISLLLLIPSILGYIFTEVNYDILTYLPEDLDSVKGEQILSDTYNIGSVTMVLLKNMQPKRVTDLKEKISSVDNVETVLWSDSFIDTSIPPDILPDDIRNVFYSENGDYTMMFVQFSQECDSKEIITAIREIKSVTNKQCLLSGLTAINSDTEELSNKQLPIYIGLAVVLALAVLFVTTESFLLPFILMGVLGISIIYNMGTNFIFGSVSYITQCIAAILQLGVTMDYSIFLVNRYNEERLTAASKEEAMARALKASVSSLFGSSLTTLFGFLALCFMQLTLGFNIGMVMAKGVVIGFASVIVILPAFLLVFDKGVNARRHKTFSPKFDGMVDFTLKHKKGFSTAFAVLLIPAIILAANVKQYYNINATLPEDLDSIVALNTLKEEFNMTTSHFIVVNDDIPAEKLIEMQNRINEVDGVSSMLAYNQYVGSTIPDSIMPDDITSFIKRGGYQVMLANSEFDAATDESNKQVESIVKIIKEYDPDGYLTGEGAMYDDLIGVTRRDFTVTSIISVLAIFILIAFIFKSFSIPVILIASIEFAIWINEGISTVMGVEIPFIAPTMISCVQLGATVDYAILLTSRFKEEISLGCDRFSAIRKAACTSVRSVFQSASIFFMVTFGVYLVSSISIVKSLCAMLARGSVISAFVIVFFLTPILLLSEGFIAKTSKNWGRRTAAGAAVNITPSAADITADNSKPDESEPNEYTEFFFTDDD